jgi:hypothetical protein
LITNIHKDEPIYIIGGGSSLIGFDFDRLKDKITIGCNKAAFIANTTYLAFFDKNFLTECREQIEEFPGIVITMEDDHIVLEERSNELDRETIICPHWKHRYQELSETRLTPLGVSERFSDGVNTGGNSGFFALNIAYLMGANPIYLLGMDMQFGYGGKKWFYKGVDINGGERQYEHMKQAFEYGAIFFDQKKVKVYNCSPISRLKGYEKFDLEDI